MKLQKIKALTLQSYLNELQEILEKPESVNIDGSQGRNEFGFIRAICNNIRTIIYDGLVPCQNYSLGIGNRKIGSIQILNELSNIVEQFRIEISQDISNDELGEKFENFEIAMFERYGFFLKHRPNSKEVDYSITS